MRQKLIPTVPKPVTPFFFDRVIGELQDILKNNLAWLDYSFGQSQRLVNKKDKRDNHYPGIHISKGEYVNLLPSQDYGNFSFFTIYDPQEVDYKANNFNNVKANFSLIFWVNLDKIFSDKVDRNKEELKAEILGVLTRKTFLKSGRISLSTIEEKAENIYNGYDMKEVNSQFLMQPFVGFRFNGDITLTEVC